MSIQGEIRERIRASLERYISESGYTQKEIAERLGVSQSSVTNWVKGKNSPDANLVIPICNLLNITVGQFYGEEETKKSPSATEAAQGEDHIILEESNRLLDALGLTREGQDLSDDDLAFLEHIIGLLDAWFDKRQ